MVDAVAEEDIFVTRMLEEIAVHNMVGVVIMETTAAAVASQPSPSRVHATPSQDPLTMAAAVRGLELRATEVTTTDNVALNTATVVLRTPTAEQTARADGAAALPPKRPTMA
ncbi:hypothetical protein DRE_01155 [Drechslerella stenobrocha 248]|uniref:Uncharacterized protein n=1 Tax=Drechslerella stenobrocha 248 TaxID=1043628 RepID=W7HMI6_9PEZI|nr:hypothetical protein DRE_01155 [Drechslerella stenobrocha 248]